jgi:hypothetical protein
VSSKLTASSLVRVSNFPKYLGLHLFISLSMVFMCRSCGCLYSASHSRVAPENVGLQKEQKYNTFARHICNEMRLCEFAKRKLATR